MRYYPQFPRTIPHRKAYSHALLTRPPLIPKDALDLHVLGLPPAFVLSQDQTLKLKAQKALSLTLSLAHLSPENPTPHKGKARIIGKPSACHLTRVKPTSSEADTPIIASRPGRSARGLIYKASKSHRPDRPHIPSDTETVKKQRRKPTVSAKSTWRRQPEAFTYCPEPTLSSATAPNPASPAPKQRLAAPVNSYLEPQNKTRKKKNDDSVKKHATN